MKAMRVVQTRTYQHLYDKHHAYTMYPAWNMFHSIQHTPPLTEMSHQHLADLHTHLLDQCTTAYLFLSDSSSGSDQDPNSSSDEEEDFQTVPMDDEHWTAEMVPERTFCIHEKWATQQYMPIPMPLWE